MHNYNFFSPPHIQAQKHCYGRFVSEDWQVNYKQMPPGNNTNTMQVWIPRYCLKTMKYSWSLVAFILTIWRHYLWEVSPHLFDSYTSETLNKYTPTPTNTQAMLRLLKGWNKSLTNSKRHSFPWQVWAPRWIFNLWHLTLSLSGGNSIGQNIQEVIPICTSIQALRCSHFGSGMRLPEKLHDGM